MKTENQRKYSIKVIWAFLLLCLIIYIAFTDTTNYFGTQIFRIIQPFFFLFYVYRSLWNINFNFLIALTSVSTKKWTDPTTFKLAIIFKSISIHAVHVVFILILCIHQLTLPSMYGCGGVLYHFYLCILTWRYLEIEMKSEKSAKRNEGKWRRKKKT